MCGIFSVISKQKPLDKQVVLSARDTMIHRGPDDQGVYFSSDKRIAMGHRRLSIIDLSENGRQPLFTMDKSLGIVFNGEIYNYLDLRKELNSYGYNFTTQTDTEVVLIAYQHWGYKALEKLDGMFAFVILNTKSKQFFLARDRLGIKPLFYYLDQNYLIVASEIKAIKMFPDIDMTIDQSAISDFLTYGYVPTPKTIYKKIRKLDPGYFGFYEKNNLVTKKYWDIEFKNELYIENNYLEKLEYLLGESIKSQLVSDVPIGVLLSGGLDSSTVTYFASKQKKGKQIVTCSVGFDKKMYSETQYARIISSEYKTEHYESIVNSDFVKKMDGLSLALYDEPFADSSSMPTYEVCRIARKHMTVALSGDGGDEIFNGYKRFKILSDRSNWIDFPFLNRFNTIIPNYLFNKRGYRRLRYILSTDIVEKYASTLDYFSPQEKYHLTNNSLANYKEEDDNWYFRKYWNNELDLNTNLRYVEMKTYLPDDILTKIDRASMAVSLEVRPPLLNHKLVEFCFSLPSDIHFRKKIELKSALKEVMMNKIPMNIINRPKKGFSVPSKMWTDENINFFKEKIIMGKCSKDGLLSRKYLKTNINNFSFGKLWAINVLEDWYSDI